MSIYVSLKENIDTSEETHGNSFYFPIPWLAIKIKFLWNLYKEEIR